MGGVDPLGQGLLGDEKFTVSSQSPKAGPKGTARQLPKDEFKFPSWLLLAILVVVGGGTSVPPLEPQFPCLRGGNSDPMWRAE